jgi:hypothetical protein
MNFIERIKGLITNPDKTMEDVAKEPRIEEAAVVIAIYAILAAISAYVLQTHITYVYTDPNVPNMAGLMTIVTVVGGLITPFIMWVIISVVLYLFSMVFGGEGKFTAVLTAMGLSAFVKIFAAVISILLLTQAPHITVEISSSDPFSSVGAMTDFYKNTFVLLSSLVLLAGLLWSSYIGVFGIKHTEKISLKSAAIVVGVPLVLCVVLQYGTVLLSLLGL